MMLPKPGPTNQLIRVNQLTELAAIQHFIFILYLKHESNSDLNSLFMKLNNYFSN